MLCCAVLAKRTSPSRGPQSPACPSKFLFIRTSASSPEGCVAQTSHLQASPLLQGSFHKAARKCPYGAFPLRGRSLLALPPSLTRLPSRARLDSLQTNKMHCLLDIDRRGVAHTLARFHTHFSLRPREPSVARLFRAQDATASGAKVSHLKKASAWRLEAQKHQASPRLKQRARC